MSVFWLKSLLAFLVKKIDEVLLTMLTDKGENKLSSENPVLVERVVVWGRFPFNAPQNLRTPDRTNIRYQIFQSS